MIEQTYQHHSYKIENNFCTVFLHTEGKSTNVISSEFVSEFKNTLKHLSTLNLKGLMIVSLKPKQFIAGANIDELSSIRSISEGTEKSRLGQDMMNAIEKLPYPSVAVIDGITVGGGLELALACTYRVASDEPHVKLCLPEVKLGIIPGWGGTQRLPLVVGLIKALELITTGKMLSGMEAKKMGLVDEVCPSTHLISVAKSFLEKKTKRVVKEPWIYKLLSSNKLLRKHFIFSKARTAILKETKGFYPAPLADLEILERTYGDRSSQSDAFEAVKLGETIFSPESKSLVGIFLMTETIRKKTFSAPAAHVSNMGLLGAGVMGGGIATLFLNKNYFVRVRDLNWPAIEKTYQHVSNYFTKLLKRKKIDAREFQSKLNHLSSTTELQGFGNMDVMIEAVVENMEVKRQVFQELSSVTSPSTIIASNTSALSITEMATAVQHPERFVGLHFFNPVEKMPLVEIIRGEKTSEATLATVHKLALDVGKTPIIVQDRPGFLVNRILGHYLLEATRLLEEGVALEKIETTIKKYGFPMGPFELMDEIGLDVSQKVGEFLAQSFSYFPRPSNLLKNMILDQRLGKKSNLGFYIHTPKGKTIDQAYVEKTVQKLTSSHKDLSTVEILDRLIGTLKKESETCLSEGIVQSKEDLNIALIFGIGFPPFRGGIL